MLARWLRKLLIGEFNIMDELGVIKAQLDDLVATVNAAATSQAAAFVRLEAAIASAGITPAQAQPLLDEIAAIKASVVTIQTSADAEAPAPVVGS